MSIRRFRHGRKRITPRLESLEERLCPSDNTGGMAFQVGPVLNVIVSDPGVNAAVVVDSGFGNVAVEWNTGGVNTFSGVSSIQFIGAGQVNSILYALIGPVPSAHDVSFNLIGNQNMFFEQMKFPSNPNLTLNVNPDATIFKI